MGSTQQNQASFQTDSKSLVRLSVIYSFFASYLVFFVFSLSPLFSLISLFRAISFFLSALPCRVAHSACQATLHKDILSALLPRGPTAHDLHMMSCHARVSSVPGFGFLYETHTLHLHRERIFIFVSSLLTTAHRCAGYIAEVVTGYGRTARNQNPMYVHPSLPANQHHHACLRVVLGVAVACTFGTRMVGQCTHSIPPCVTCCYPGTRQQAQILVHSRRRYTRATLSFTAGARPSRTTLARRECPATSLSTRTWTRAKSKCDRSTNHLFPAARRPHIRSQSAFLSPSRDASRLRGVIASSNFRHTHHDLPQSCSIKNGHTLN